MVEFGSVAFTSFLIDGTIPFSRGLKLRCFLWIDVLVSFTSLFVSVYEFSIHDHDRPLLLFALPFLGDIEDTAFYQ